ncbi:MAG: putative colanic acid biosynthesis acetyltransferase [Rubripirellula sp.]
MLLFRPSPRIAFRWRRFLLRCFGAKIGENVRIYNSASVFLPRNLTLAAHCVIGPRVDVYCVAPIDCGEHVMVSQNVELCAATHDYREVDLPLVASPICIEPESWVCASAFIGPGVTIGRGAVVGARSVVFKDVASEDIVAGNPAKRIRSRTEHKSAGRPGT